MFTLLTFRKYLDLSIESTSYSETDSDRYTALDYASNWGNTPYVHLLLQAGAETHQALRMTGDSRIQKMLLAAGADPSKGSKFMMDITLSTKEAARKWLKSLQC